MIKLKNVTFTYHGQNQDGLRNINLTIKGGECILLCGASGCGKTTVTRLINGLIPYFYTGDLYGEVNVCGMNIAETPMYCIAEKVGSVFQNPRSQFFNVDTDSEIAFGMENLSYPQSKIKDRVKKTVRELNIENLLGRSIFELSGGEKQKIAFASIYSINPDVYILDEPSSNLDVDAIDELRRIIHLLKKQGKTILIAEHRLYYLKDIVDRIVYMEKGKIKNIYTPQQFLQLPLMIRENMGLRATELREVMIKKKQIVIRRPILEIRDLNLHYKKQIVLSGINLCASQGEVIGIIGHNGAGKSTFARTLCGLHKDYNGVIHWRGEKTDIKHRLKLCYMVMQDVNYQLFAESVEQECCFGIKNPEKNLVEQTMKELKIYEYRQYHPNRLSGGQKQRTAVAVSMICQKEILIFDEPTSGLDFDSMVKVTKLFKTLASMGKIILVVTHDYEFISLACSRILHFDNGTLKNDFDVNSQNQKKLQEFFIVSEDSSNKSKIGKSG